MMRIGVISDTHGLLREEVLEILRGCDCILHGGDINNRGVLDTLEQIAPVYAVRGNNDKEWAEHLPHDLTVQLKGLKIFMVHNKKEIQNLPLDADIVIFGHSHKYFEQMVDGKLWLNPGSCGKRRFGQEISFAVLKIDGENYQVQKIVLPQAQGLNRLYNNVGGQAVGWSGGGPAPFVIVQISEERMSGVGTEKAEI